VVAVVDEVEPVLELAVDEVFDELPPAPPVPPVSPVSAGLAHPVPAARTREDTEMSPRAKFE
jgi:hypothetical protein